MQSDKDIFIGLGEPNQPFQPSDGELLLLIIAFAKETTEGRVFGIQIQDVHDQRAMHVGIKHEEQHLWLKPWLDLFAYGGVKSMFDANRSEYVVEPPASWHSVLFESIAAKTETFVGEDPVWQENSVIKVGLIETATRRVVDSVRILRPEHPLRARI